MRAGLGHADVGPCPTHRRASADRLAGNRAASQVACEGREVEFFAIRAENPRSAGSRAHHGCYVRADLDVGACPTHTGASTGSVAGGGEARATACGTGQVAIFAIRCRVLYRLWGCLLGVREDLVRTTVFLQCVRK